MTTITLEGRQALVSYQAVIPALVREWIASVERAIALRRERARKALHDLAFHTGPNNASEVSSLMARGALVELGLILPRAPRLAVGHPVYRRTPWPFS